MTKKSAFSGVQPSGQPSLGNYLGAFKHFVNFQTSHNMTVCVVDNHAITVRQNPEKLRQQTYALAAWYLAVGLDPEKCTFFVQSHVPAHAELAWILSTFTHMGELERMTQYKDKSKRHTQNINAGLFTYPTLMAADILLYHVDEVPVGDDQRQHIELTRDIATRFNNIYGDIFKIPEGIFPKTASRVMDLQNPENKMSKSIDSLGTIFLIDELKVIEKKIKRAVTDTLECIDYDRKKQAGISNLLEIYAATVDKPLNDVVAEFKGSTQYGSLKSAVAEAVVSALEPVHQRYFEWMDDTSALDKIFKIGADKASKTANKTLKSVQNAMGYVLY